MPFSKAYRKREHDILDQHAFDLKAAGSNRTAIKVANDKAEKLLTKLYADRYHAMSVLRMALESEDRS